MGPSGELVIEQQNLSNNYAGYTMNNSLMRTH